MIAFAFTFPGGRYHATPWGRHVNEADVAWPPEPVRILRALIAVWWRKGDHDVFPKAALDDLIDTLAEEPPVFNLPEAVHTHVRAFMPAPEKKRLIFDAFLKVRPHDRLIVAWPTGTLLPEQEALAAYLLARLSYLGRAESWAEGELARDWDGNFNAPLRTAGVRPPRGTTPVEVVAARSPSDWRNERARQITAAAALKGSKARLLLDTLPKRLCDAIAVDTGAWQAVGWSTPPPLRKLWYDRPQIGPLPPTRHRYQNQIRDRTAIPGRPEVARYLLAGRPKPRVEDALRIGEVLRRALIAKFSDTVLPVEFSSWNGDPARFTGALNPHAFYLPEANAEGWIDRLVVYAPQGFSDAARSALDRLTLLYVQKASSLWSEGDNERGDRGRKEWRVALDQLGASSEVRGSRLLDASRVWVSTTPYLSTQDDRLETFDFDALVGRYRAAFLSEWQLRRPADPQPKVEPIRQQGQPRFGVGPRERSPLHFARTRPRGFGGPQPDAMGASLRLTFETGVAGPIAFGKHAQFGLGLFESEIVKS